MKPTTKIMIIILMMLALVPVSSAYPYEHSIPISHAEPLYTTGDVVVSPDGIMKNVEGYDPVLDMYGYSHVDPASGWKGGLVIYHNGLAASRRIAFEQEYPVILHHANHVHQTMHGWEKDAFWNQSQPFQYTRL
jgi:hypothetical protein